MSQNNLSVANRKDSEPLTIENVPNGDGAPSEDHAIRGEGEGHVWIDISGVAVKIVRDSNGTIRIQAFEAGNEDANQPLGEIQVAPIDISATAAAEGDDESDPYVKAECFDCYIRDEAPRSELVELGWKIAAEKNLCPACADDGDEESN